jgi:hypothetical protein
MQDLAASLGVTIRDGDGVTGVERTEHHVTVSTACGAR